MIYDVYCFMKQEAKEGAHQKEIIKRTAEATKTSVSTLKRIIKAGKE